MWECPKCETLFASQRECPVCEERVKEEERISSPAYVTWAAEERARGNAERQRGLSAEWGALPSEGDDGFRGHMR